MASWDKQLSASAHVLSILNANNGAWCPWTKSTHAVTPDKSIIQNMLPKCLSQRWSLADPTLRWSFECYEIDSVWAKGTQYAMFLLGTFKSMDKTQEEATYVYKKIQN